MPGLACSHSGSSCATTSPSRPRAQKRSTVHVAAGEAQPCPIDSAAVRARVTAVRKRALATRPEPATREAGPLEAAAQIRVVAHHPPHQPAPVVLEHRDHDPLVDTEIV